MDALSVEKILLRRLLKSIWLKKLLPLKRDERFSKNIIGFNLI